MLADRPVIAGRLRDLFRYIPDYGLADLHLLKIGRHFRLHPGVKLILGRDQSENEEIQMMARAGGVIYRPLVFRGPTCFALRSPESHEERTIGEMIAGYSQDNKTRYVIKKHILDGEESLISVNRKYMKEDAVRLRIDKD